MSSNRSLNNKINRLHERCLRIVCNDKKSNFEDLLKRHASITVHHQNIRFLAIEMFKVLKRISPQIGKEIFQFRDAIPNQLRKQTDFKSHLYIVFSVAQKV